LPATENLSVLSLEYKNLDEIRKKDRKDPLGNMKKFICEVQNKLGYARNIYELKVGKLPDSPLIHSHEYNDGEYFAPNNYFLIFIFLFRFTFFNFE
jgi:hypothetical protein